MIMNIFIHQQRGRKIKRDWKYNKHHSTNITELSYSGNIGQFVNSGCNAYSVGPSVNILRLFTFLA